jgi:LPXTG-site transpeptidase (sortase) family protein
MYERRSSREPAVTEPEHRHRRSADGSGWRSDRARPVILLAGIAAIVFVAAGVAFVLGGGPGGLGGAALAPTAQSSLLASLTPAGGSPTPSGLSQTAAPGSAAPGSSVPTASVPPTVDGEPGIQANRIRIDRLGINLAIVEGDGIDAPLGKVAHFPTSAWPGGGTNIYIYGHARTGMFIRLWNARVGDTVALGLVDGTTRTYVVTKILPSVPWDAVQYLDPTPAEQLTLQTCTSYYETAPRFVVIAVPAP